MNSDGLEQYIPSSLIKHIPPWLLKHIADYPKIAMAVAAVIIVLFIILVFSTIRSKLKKNKRKGRSQDFLCKKRRKVIIDGVHSFYLSNPKVTFTVTVSDLVARGIIENKSSKCPSGGGFSLVLKRNKNGHLFDAHLTCSIHGISGLSE